MTGPEHYREAERLLNQARDIDGDGNRYFLVDSEADVAAAQVHATLALAAATVARIGAENAGNTDYWTAVHDFQRTVGARQQRAAAS